ncbi:MAG: hypothetical protein NC921_04055 [Candidatus Omnitrophica bacterium]|nr:hypothetical protein [Candidatus Omnitrophota bacterium]
MKVYRVVEILSSGVSSLKNTYFKAKLQDENEKVYYAYVFRKKLEVNTELYGELKEKKVKGKTIYTFYEYTPSVNDLFKEIKEMKKNISEVILPKMLFLENKLKEIEEKQQ